MHERWVGLRRVLNRRQPAATAVGDLFEGTNGTYERFERRLSSLDGCRMHYLVEIQVGAHNFLN